MSQEEINNNFNWEKYTHEKFFLPYYRDVKNWIVTIDHINSNHKNDWDVKVEIEAGQFRTIDEKALRKEENFFYIEIIQDLATMSWGWFFKEFDWVLYSMWGDGMEYPSSLYLIDLKRLKQYIFSLSGKQPILISKHGWGITWNIQIFCNVLIYKNIAQKLL
jgi:hypothetical protein